MSMLTELIAIAEAVTAPGRCILVASRESVPAPYIVLSRVSAIRQNDLDKNGGADQLTNTRMQVSIFALSYVEAETIGATLKAALLDWDTQNTVQMEMDQFEEDTKLHHLIIDLSIWS